MSVKTKYLPENTIFKFADNMYIMTTFKDAIYKRRHIKQEVSYVFEVKDSIYTELAKGIIVGIQGYDIDNERFKIIDEQENEYEFNIEFPLEEVGYEELLVIKEAMNKEVNKTYQKK